MILSTLPGVLPYIQYGVEQSLLFIAIIEWLCYLAAITCAIGLFLAKEWARKLTVWLFFVYFIWSLFVVYHLSGPSLSLLIESQSKAFNLLPDLGQKVFLVLLITNLIWPIIVVLFLTHPRVKMIFDPNYDPAKEQSQLEENHP